VSPLRWWEGAALYQIYVRSWLDSDGDGSGDLRGVIDGLDYLAWLGVDGIWLSPTMPSPNADWGYDVSDYLGVHPDLGTMEDMDRLVAEAGRRGIRVLLDLVPNHTSSEHTWFVDSRRGRDAEKRDWYVWADRVGSGPPNNWLEARGDSAWTLDPASGQYYLHNFLPGQPDLNWWNEKVHEAFEEILRFWLDRGISGFRIDVAHALYKDALLRDDPVVPAPDAPYRQRRVFSMNRPETHDVYRAWRKITDSYDPPRLLLGETWVLDPERLAEYYGRDDELNLAFNFFFATAEFDARRLPGVVEETLAVLPSAACPVWMGSNHDISRFPSRWANGDPARARAALVALCTLPGAVVLYAGDELGLPDVDVPAERQRDPITWHAPGRFNRDRARTPMPWDDGPNYGFTAAGVEPWLPAGDRAGLSVAEQQGDPQSFLLFARRLLALRRETLSAGPRAYRRLPGPPGSWVYASGSVTVALNLSGEGLVVDLPDGQVLLSSRGEARAGDRHHFLRPWEAVVMQTGSTNPGKT
jgi:alpha-glucosidase